MPAPPANAPVPTSSAPAEAADVRVLLRVPDVHYQAAGLNGRAAPKGWRRAVLGFSSPSRFIKSMTSRVLLLAIALSSLMLFYFALNGTTAPKPKMPDPNAMSAAVSAEILKSTQTPILVPESQGKSINVWPQPPLAAAKPAAQNRLPPPSSLPVIGQTGPNGQSSLVGQTNLSDAGRGSRQAISSVTASPPSSRVQPIRSLPAESQASALLGRSVEHTADRSATLTDAARREVFSWGNAQFEGSVIKLPAELPPHMPTTFK